MRTEGHKFMSNSSSLSRVTLVKKRTLTFKLMKKINDMHCRAAQVN